MLKRIVKCLIPQFLIRRIRYIYIIRKHKKCCSELNWIVEDLSGNLLSQIRPLKDFDSQKIIWQYWAQGFETSDMPDLVRICLNSVEIHKQEYRLIRISDENIYEYIEIPDWLKSKVAKMSKAHFSDLLRCVVLSLYGGLWLDAAVFLSGNIPEYITKNEFFMYRRDVREKNKHFWEDTFAYYFGYSPEFLVKSLIGIMYSNKGGGRFLILQQCYLISGRILIVHQIISFFKY